MKKLLINLFFVLAVFGLAQAELQESSSKTEGTGQGRPEFLGDPFLEAEYLFYSGDLLQAKLFYHDYLSQNPSGKKSHHALYRLGEIDQSNHSYATALDFYQILLQDFPNSLLGNSARFNMAVCHFELAHFDLAEALFKKVLRSTPDKKQKWEIMVRLSWIDGSRMDYEKAFSRLKQVHGQIENKEVRKRAVEIAEEFVNEKLGEVQISALIQKLGKGFPVDLLLLKNISLYRNSGDNAKYIAGLENFIQYFPNHSRKAEVEGWLNQSKQNSESKIIIGVVLPLTGKLALTGQRVLQGIQLAVNKLSFQSREKMKLEVRDSGANLSVNKIIADLAGLPNIVGIIGPLLTDEVKTAGAVARRYKIPLFSPTASTHGLVDDNPFVFRNALTRKIQAEFLAEYAVNTLHLKRFAVLYPLEQFGLELKDIFVRQVKGFGGEVVAVSGYERSQTDFKKQILELGGIVDEELEKTARDLLLGNGEIMDFSDASILSRPIVDMGHWSEEDIEKLKVSLELSYDAVFIPGVYDKVGLIIPQLAFYNVSDVTLLGASGWNSPELVKLGGRHLKSVLFVDGYYPDSPQPKVREFVQEFNTNFGEEPVYLSAQSFDAANIFIKNILEGADNRLKMLESLKAVKDFPGITGRTTLLPSGDSKKNIFALTVKRKKIFQEN